MTFNDITIKNFKSQIQKYLIYFLCNSFSIMVFFMNTTLIYNKALSKRDESNFISIIFYISMTAIIVFSVFFINYAHTAFIKSRYKEFGIYMTLGMTTKDIRKIILFENTIIIFGSLFTGLVSGIIFSRLFQMIVINLLNLSGIGYSLSYKSFVLTVSVFAVIFAVVIILSRFATRNLEISELLKKSVKGEGTTQYKLLPGFIGILLIVSSFVMLYFIAGNKNLNTNPVAVMSYFAVCFAGVYFTISNFGKTILGILRRNKSYYYKNLLTLTEINYKFNQNKKIIFVLSILSAMIVFFVASPFSLLSQTVDISAMNQPNHVEYAAVGGVNNITKEILASIIKDSSTPITNEKEIEFLQLYYNGSVEKYDLLKTKPVLSEKAYNTLTNSKLSLKSGEAVNIILAWEPGFHGIAPNSTINFKDGDNSFAFTVKASIHSNWAVGMAAFPTSSGIVLNNEDYDKIKNEIHPENIGLFHIFNFKDWRKTQNTISALKNALEEANKSVSVTNPTKPNLLKIAARLDTYNSLKQGYSLFIFVTSIMGFLFFIAAGSVLYFKQFTEVGSAKAKFYKLYKLGISRKEAAAIISKELKLTFFMPLVFGGIMGYSFIYFMTYWVNGQEVIKNFMLNATIIVIAYILFQTVFYFFTKSKYTREVLGRL